QRQLITGWYGVSSAVGADLSTHIQQHLDCARIIVLFISPDFLCTEQLKRIATDATERQQNGRVTVLLVLLRRTHGWENTAFGVLPAIPRNKPVTEFAHPDAAILKVVHEVRAVVEQLRISG